MFNALLLDNITFSGQSTPVSLSFQPLGLCWITQLSLSMALSLWTTLESMEQLYTVWQTTHNVAQFCKPQMTVVLDSGTFQMELQYQIQMHFQLKLEWMCYLHVWHSIEQEMTGLYCYITILVGWMECIVVRYPMQVVSHKICTLESSLQILVRLQYSACYIASTKRVTVVLCILRVNENGYPSMNIISGSGKSDLSYPPTFLIININRLTTVCQ